jgi:hypothetical protein
MHAEMRSENLKCGHLENRDKCGRIILKWTFLKLGGKGRTAFNWLRIKTSSKFMRTL